MASRTREHFWDALRAALMLLGIPYHVALSYRVGDPWIVHSGESAAGLFTLAEAIHLFRMPTFFVIAGYFAMLLLGRRAPIAWLKGRWQRLALPFLATMATFVPLMNLACEFSAQPADAAIRSFLHEAATSGGYWVRHLWFIIVLLYCSTGLALLVRLRPSLATAKVPARIDRRLADNLFFTVLAAAVVLGLWEAGAVEGFYAAGLATMVPQQILRIDDLIAYAPWFVLGALLCRSPLLLRRFVLPSRAIAAAALLAGSGYLVWSGGFAPWAGRFLAALAALPLAQVAVAMARRYADRPIPWVRRFVDAAFAIYLVHMPVIVALVWLGQGVPIPTALKAVLVMALALALSYGFYRLIAPRPLLALLFNGDWPRDREAGT